MESRDLDPSNFTRQILYIRIRIHLKLQFENLSTMLLIIGIINYIKA